MTDATLLTIILALHPVHGHQGEHLALARAAAQACEREGQWAGPACLVAVLAIAREEGGLRAAPGRKHACGGWQTLARRPFRWRGMRLVTPKCSELEHPEIGAKWAVRVLETKWRWCDGSKDRWRCAVTHYNGSRFKVAYARRVLRRVADVGARR